MSDPRFLQDGFDKQLAHAIEECGEFLAAAGKTQRWGRDSVNPLLPPDQQETNEAWTLRELDDAVEALGRLRQTMTGATKPPETAGCVGKEELGGCRPYRCDPGLSYICEAHRDA